MFSPALTSYYEFKQAYIEFKRLKSLGIKFEKPVLGQQPQKVVKAKSKYDFRRESIYNDIESDDEDCELENEIDEIELEVPAEFKDADIQMEALDNGEYQIIVKLPESCRGFEYQISSQDIETYTIETEDCTVTPVDDVPELTYCDTEDEENDDESASNVYSQSQNLKITRIERNV